MRMTESLLYWQEEDRMLVCSVEDLLDILVYHLFFEMVSLFLLQIHQAFAWPVSQQFVYLLREVFLWIGGDTTTGSLPLCNFNPLDFARDNKELLPWFGIELVLGTGGTDLFSSCWFFLLLPVLSQGPQSLGAPTFDDPASWGPLYLGLGGMTRCVFLCSKCEFRLDFSSLSLPVVLLRRGGMWDSSLKIFYDHGCSLVILLQCTKMCMKLYEHSSLC